MEGMGWLYRTIRLLRAPYGANNTFAGTQMMPSNTDLATRRVRKKGFLNGSIWRPLDGEDYSWDEQQVLVMDCIIYFDI